MPVYEYECEACHKIVEMWQSMSDAPLATCPECTGSVKKIISQSAFHLKGGGWYADGYNSPKEKVAAAASSDKAGSTDKKASCPQAATCPCAS